MIWSGGKEDSAGARERDSTKVKKGVSNTQKRRPGGRTRKSAGSDGDPPEKKKRGGGGGGKGGFKAVCTVLESPKQRGRMHDFARVKRQTALRSSLRGSSLRQYIEEKVAHLSQTNKKTPGGKRRARSRKEENDK